VPWLTLWAVAMPRRQMICLRHACEQLGQGTAAACRGACCLGGAWCIAAFGFRLRVRRLYRAPTKICQLEDRLHAGDDCTAMKRSSCPALAGRWLRWLSFANAHRFPKHARSGGRRGPWQQLQSHPGPDLLCASGSCRLRGSEPQKVQPRRALCHSYYHAADLRNTS